MATESTEAGWAFSRRMAEVVAQERVEPSGADLPAWLTTILAGGLAEEGDYLLLASEAGLHNAGPADDATGTEASVNHFHVDAQTAGFDHLREAFAAAEHIATLVRGRADGRPVRIVVSLDEGEHPNATVRFYRLRPGEIWLDDDLGSYAEAVAYQDVT